MAAETEKSMKEMRKAPNATFKSPAAVLDDKGLSVEQKREILDAWALDCRELQTADDEGMPSGEHAQVRLQDVEDALSALPSS